MNEILEILRRRKWLFIIPFAVVFIVPVLVSLVFLRSYESNSMLWLESNASAASVLARHGGGASSDNPATAQASALRQLMQSRRFVTQVIEGTALKSEMGTAKERDETIDFVRDNTQIEEVGPNAVRVTFVGRSPGEAVAVVRTTTSEFVEWVHASARKQSRETIQLFTEQADQYRAQLETATADLQAYREQHPETQQLDIAERLMNPPKVSASAAVRAEYSRLKLAAEYAQQQYDESLKDLAEARVLATLQEQRYTRGFRTVDQAVAPISFSMRRMAIAMFMAFVAALIIGITAVAWAEYSDKTLHSGRDVEEALDLPVLTEVPLHSHDIKRA